MADRVRMKSKSTFDNPFIYNHTEGREGRTTVQDGDEFSTEPEHADQLELSKLAEKIDGDASDRTDRQEMLKGAQTPAKTSAVVTDRRLDPAVPAPKAEPAKA